MSGDQHNIGTRRVRTLGAIVYESTVDDRGNTLTTIQSPDGTFRVECTIEPDDRAPEWERTRIVATAGDEVLVDLRLHATIEPIEFPLPGSVALNLRGRYGDHHRLRVNVTQRTFWLDDDEASVPHPLTMLASRLAPPPPPPRAVVQPTPRQARFEAFIGAVGVPFAIGGLWLSLTAKTTSDRLAGIAGVVMGGFAIANAVAQRRKRAPPRTDAAAPPATAAPKPASRLLPYAPMLALAVEFAWLAVLLVGFLFVVGDAPYKQDPHAASVRLWDVIAALPACAGLLLGIVGIARGAAHQAVEWVCLLLGLAGCALIVLVFGREFFG